MTNEDRVKITLGVFETMEHGAIPKICLEIVISITNERLARSYTPHCRFHARLGGLSSNYLHPSPLTLHWDGPQLVAEGDEGMLRNRASRIFLGTFFAVFFAPALAHDPSHPELNGWFDKLASGRGLCCSNADGFAVADPDWDSKNGHYRVRLENKWIDVPDEALITEPNRAGRTMVWPMPMIEGDTIRIRCFMPGSMI